MKLLEGRTQRITRKVRITMLDLQRRGCISPGDGITRHLIAHEAGVNAGEAMFALYELGAREVGNDIWRLDTEEGSGS